MPSTPKPNAATSPCTSSSTPVHVLEYLWKAAWCLHPTADPAAEIWVAHHALQILQGKATEVATAIADQATHADLSATGRKNLDRCVDYLTSKADYLHYDQALDAGWPIATGIIDRTCRHLIKDRTGHHRRPLGPDRRRSRTQTPRRDQQRRLQRLLEIPPQTRTPPHPPKPLPSPPAMINNSLQGSRTQRRS
jgi:hypothetical protein